MEELKAMICTWLRATQARVPGASIMLVVTHIDLVEKSEVEELKKMSEEEDENILPLHVINEGESFRVIA